MAVLPFAGGCPHPDLEDPGGIFHDGQEFLCLEGHAVEILLGLDHNFSWECRGFERLHDTPHDIGLLLAGGSDGSDPAGRERGRVSHDLGGELDREEQSKDQRFKPRDQETWTADGDNGFTFVDPSVGGYRFDGDLTLEGFDHRAGQPVAVLVEEVVVSFQNVGKLGEH